jgi:hypothetical protein
MTYKPLFGATLANRFNLSTMTETVVWPVRNGKGGDERPSPRTADPARSGGRTGAAVAGVGHGRQHLEPAARQHQGLDVAHRDAADPHLAHPHRGRRHGAVASRCATSRPWCCRAAGSRRACSACRSCAACAASRSGAAGTVPLAVPTFAVKSRSATRRPIRSASSRVNTCATSRPWCCRAAGSRRACSACRSCAACAASRSRAVYNVAVTASPEVVLPTVTDTRNGGACPAS